MNRRAALKRTAPLRATAALARKTGLRAVTPLKAKSAPKAGVAPRKPARDTGPSRLVRHIVLERDSYRCARCGRPAGPGIGSYSLQHRLARGVGGDSRLSNLVVLCGNALTLCHGQVEARKSREDIAKGYRLEAPQKPEDEAVMYFERPDGPGFTAWLGDDGSLLGEDGIVLYRPESGEAA